MNQHKVLLGLRKLKAQSINELVSDALGLGVRRTRTNLLHNLGRKRRYGLTFAHTLEGRRHMRDQHSEHLVITFDAALSHQSVNDPTKAVPTRLIAESALVQKLDPLVQLIRSHGSPLDPVAIPCMSQWLVTRHQFAVHNFPLNLFNTLARQEVSDEAPGQRVIRPYHHHGTRVRIPHIPVVQRTHRQA